MQLAGCRHCQPPGALPPVEAWPSQRHGLQKPGRRYTHACKPPLHAFLFSILSSLVFEFGIGN
ncbi:hypothetical protein BDA96_03G291200 [Sorghum bicolor]|uniref:Uncharacterized protein n=1 Tax=Sorghum bicolor TaxID=4558 RepID=A0A921RGA2_SORBI|nr:hypothetical protein BDA96_03G291200 [Sorghum bicolor]